MHAELLRLCLTFCDPMDCDLPGPLSMGFSGKTTGVDRHALLQGSFLTPGIEPESLLSPTLTGRFFATRTTWEAHVYSYNGMCGSIFQFSITL